MHAFADDIQLWIRHYAKGPWYASASMMATTGYIESGKFVTWLALDAAFLAVLAACLDAGMRRRQGSGGGGTDRPESSDHHADGRLHGGRPDDRLPGLRTAAVFSGFRFRRPGLLVIVVGVAAAICSINSKSTGLVYLCFMIAGAGLYCLFKRRDLFGGSRD